MIQSKYKGENEKKINSFYLSLFLVVLTGVADIILDFADDVLTERTADFAETLTVKS